jgi:hypothetical protein
MNYEIAKLWSAAANSGEFSQSFGYLDKDGGMCILGVLCNLAVVAGVCDVEEVKKHVYSFDNQLGRIPKSVQAWAEMYGQNGEMRGEFVNLNFYNDVLHLTLPELGDMILENWERL